MEKTSRLCEYVERNMKRISVPFIDGLESLDLSELEQMMEAEASKVYIDQVNWPEAFPYMPSTSVLLARTADSLVVLFQVRGLDLRGTLMDDNEMVCADSCCEFFVSDPKDGTYYNFEVNCIGTLKAAKRRSRTDYCLYSREQLSRITRLTSLPRKTVLRTEIHEWQVALCIPFYLMGFSSEYIPAELYANFYKCADKSSHPHYVSWNPVGTPSPDFHRPEYFGILSL